MLASFLCHPYITPFFIHLYNIENSSRLYDKVVTHVLVCSLTAGATAHSDAYFGEGSGLIHLTSVKCSGLEYNVTECETQNLENSFGHSLDVGVKCQPGMLLMVLSV